MELDSCLFVVLIFSKPSLKEKSGAEMAPGWSRFHVHRMAPFRYRFSTVFFSNMIIKEKNHFF